MNVYSYIVSPTLTIVYCQAQVQIQIQSRSIPGPFQIYFKSFQSIPIQNKMIWTRSWCYFHCATTTTLKHWTQTLSCNLPRMVQDDIQDPNCQLLSEWHSALSNSNSRFHFISLLTDDNWRDKFITKVVYSIWRKVSCTSQLKAYKILLMLQLIQSIQNTKLHSFLRGSLTLKWIQTYYDTGVNVRDG